MTSSATFSAVAASNSAMAASSAHRAKVERCKAEIAQFDSRNATALEMQSYADCVDSVYPPQLAGPELLVAKVAVALALIGAPLGVWWAHKDFDGDPIGWILGALLGASLLPFVVGCLAAAVVGAHWLLT